MLALYTDRLSARSGDTVALHASATQGPCRLEIARVGAGRTIVLNLDNLTVGDHPIPAHADRDGCGWPAALEIEIGADWPSGYYDLRLTDAAGEEAHHFVVVKPPLGAPTARTALVLATNTYHAYNYFGGANASIAMSRP